MVAGLNGIGSNQHTSFLDQDSLAKNVQISELIQFKWFMVAPIEKVDQAFEIAKKIKSFTVRQYALFDICHAYLILRPPECEKAFEVAKYRGEKTNDIQNLLNAIVCKCLNMTTSENLALAEKIFASYPEQMALSQYRKEILSREHY